MRRLWVLGVIGLLLGWGQPGVFAQPEEHAEEPAVLNSPVNVWQEFKAAVDIINPQPEALYRFEKEEWDAGVAGSLYDVVSKDYHLGRAKIGYGLSNYGYVGADVDLAGVYGSVARGKVSALDKIAAIWSKFATTGIHGGRDFELEDWDYGFTIGVSIPWPSN